MPGWKYLSREFGFSQSKLMAHRPHVALGAVKAAIKRADNTARQRKRRGGKADMSLDAIARRLSRMATTAEAQGNSDTAVRALTALQSTLQQIREIQAEQGKHEHAGPPVTFVVNFVKADAQTEVDRILDEIDRASHPQLNSTNVHEDAKN